MPEFKHKPEETSFVVGNWDTFALRAICERLEAILTELRMMRAEAKQAKPVRLSADDVWDLRK